MSVRSIMFRTPTPLSKCTTDPSASKSGLGTLARTRQVVHIEDVRAQAPYLEGNPAVVALADLAGARTLLIVPMLRENQLIGSLAIYRQEVCGPSPTSKSICSPTSPSKR